MSHKAWWRIRAGPFRSLARVCRVAPATGPVEPIQRLRSGGYTWTVRTTHLDLELRALLGNPDPSVPGAAGADPSRFFLKHYARPSPRKLAKLLLGTAPARNAFDMGRRLQAAGIPTAAPIAVGVRRRAGVPLESLLVTEYLTDALPLARWQGDRLDAARDLAGLIHDLDAAGFVHGDLNFWNLMCDPEGRWYLIDLDTVRDVGVVSDRQSQVQLARWSRKALADPRVSRADRARFLIAYCRLRGVAWKTWWRAIEAINAATAIRRARHPRPSA